MTAGRKQQQLSRGAVALVALLVVAAASRAGALRVCNIDTSALETCKSYCKAGSRESKPSQGCCSEVRGADIRCLCRYKSLFRAYGYDPDRAMQIPSKCGFRGATTNPCG